MSSRSDSSPRTPYVLGLDLGHASIGWALLHTEDGTPCRIAKAGVRCFDAGVSGDFNTGRDESRATERREKRQMRRQHSRRARRLKKIFRLLQRKGFLPEGDYTHADARHENILKLDAKLREKHQPEANRVDAHVLAYQLRTLALRGPLDPFALGRALYHLAQRRGYASNRRGAATSEKETGVVLGGISELEQKIKDSGALTLGEYFSGLDPEKERIRERYTSRSMYLKEFEEIWKVQKPHHKALTEDFKNEMEKAFFFQRPLRSQKHVVGKCELEPTKRRARLAFRTTQEFRLRQRVLDLKVRIPEKSERSLTSEEQNTLTTELRLSGDLTFAKIRKLLGFKRTWKFNIEEGGEKKVIGNRTDSALAKVFGEGWWDLPDEQRDRIVLDLISIQNKDALKRRGENTHGLQGEAAEEFGEIELEDGYANLSVRAMEKLLAPMSNGESYATARKTVYPDSFKAGDSVGLLEPVEKALGNLRNPAVSRAMSELRKVVNAIVRQHGKPEKIHIELARDLKHSKKIREKHHKKNNAQRKQREDARAKIIAEAKGIKPSKQDIEKVRLAEECGWQCPYTGKCIAMADLVSSVPQFDVEHIIPASRSLDNSFLNKTLCDAQENRRRKRNKTPFEAYSGDEEGWEEILNRVRRFRSDAGRIKLERFLMEEIDDDFLNRDLAETRYISSLAADYTATLYGGRYDEDGVTRIQVSAGRTTAHLRREWRLNSILGGDTEKSRDDHRHHAVDAICIALTSPSTIKTLARAAETAEKRGHRLFAPVPEPWQGFLDEAKSAIEGINVSRRVSRRVNGALHKDSIFSKEYQRNGKTVRHIRKRLNAMSKGEIQAIVDPSVKAAVLQKLKESGVDDPKKAFVEKTGEYPSLRSATERTIEIKKARIEKATSAIPVGQGSRQRFVEPGNNHHTVIVAVLDDDGNEVTWEAHTVTLYEAKLRLKEKRKREKSATGAKKDAVVQRDWGKGKRFKFSIAPGEFLVIEEDSKETLVRVTSVSKADIECVRHTDARPHKERSKIPGARIRGKADAYRKRKTRKVSIGPLGELTPAND